MSAYAVAHCIAPELRMAYKLSTIINEDNLAFSGKSPIIIILANAIISKCKLQRQRFNGNAYVRDLFFLDRNIVVRRKGGEEMQRRVTRDKGERRVHVLHLLQIPLSLNEQKIRCECNYASSAGNMG